MVNWQLVGDLWSQLKHGQLLMDPFPTFRINIIDRDSSLNILPSVEVAREYETGNHYLDIKVEQINTAAQVSIWWMGAGGEAPQLVTKMAPGDSSTISLGQGENYVGFLIETTDDQGRMNWAGFKWIKITVNNALADMPSQDQNEELSLEECDVTAYMTYEIEQPQVTTFSETSPCSHDCNARIHITNDYSEDVKIYYLRYANARDAVAWTGEKWEGFDITGPGESQSTVFLSRVAANDSCQWSSSGISKFLAIREAAGCQWLMEEYKTGFEKSGIQMIEVPDPCK
jgi:hypothetical protein